MNVVLCHLDLEFSRSNIELDIFQQKMVQLLWNENEHIDWRLVYKWGHQIWPQAWPWPWIFNMEFAIFQLKIVLVAKKQKTNLWIEHMSSNVTIITLAMALTFCWSYLTSHMSGMNGPIATKQKKNHWLNARHQIGAWYSRKLPGRLSMFVCCQLFYLTHWGWMMHICITNLGHHWFK